MCFINNIDCFRSVLDLEFTVQVLSQFYYVTKEELILFIRFPHLASQIFGELDGQTLVKCREVNESWKQGDLLKGSGAVPGKAGKAAALPRF